MRPPSCGAALLRGPRECFDYVLFVTDGSTTAKVLCHKGVLMCHSPKFRELIVTDNYFALDVRVQPGFLPAMLELLQYLYLKDPSLLASPRSKLLQLCAWLQMPQEFLQLRDDTAKKVENFRVCELTIQPAREHTAWPCDYAETRCLLAEVFAQQCETKPAASVKKLLAPGRKPQPPPLRVAPPPMFVKSPTQDESDSDEPESPVYRKRILRSSRKRTRGGTVY